MAAGEDLCLAQRAVTAQRAAGFDRCGAAVTLSVTDLRSRRRVEDQRAAVLGAKRLHIKNIVFGLGVDIAGNNDFSTARGHVRLEP